MPGTTSRLALPYIQGTDNANTIDETSQALAEKLDPIMPIFSVGTAANRPISTPGSPGKTGQLYYATDTGVLSFDFGTGWLDLTAAAGSQVFQTGDLKATLATSAPAGWLMADGSTVSRTTFAALFALIGTQHNTGGEAGTDFRLPDWRGRGIVGKGTHADVDSLADSDGLAVASRTPKHTHTNPNTGLNLGGSLSVNSGTQFVVTQGHNHSQGSTGGSGPAYQVANVMIKT